MGTNAYSFYDTSNIVNRSVDPADANMCLVDRDTVKDFRSSACWREVLKAAMTQLLLYYTRMLELLKRAGPEGAAIVRDAVTIPSIMYEIKRFNRA